MRREAEQKDEKVCENLILSPTESELGKLVFLLETNLQRQIFIFQQSRDARSLATRSAMLSAMFKTPMMHWFICVPVICEGMICFGFSFFISHVV